MHEVTRQHISMAHALLHRCGVTRVENDYDDQHAACLEGLARAAVRYQAGCGAEFDTYAWNAMFFARLDYLRANDNLTRGDRAIVNAGGTLKRRDGTPISPAPPLPVNPMDWTEHYGTLGSGTDPGYDEITARDIMEWADSVLTAREAFVFRLRLEHETAVTIGELLGVSASRVSQIYTAACKKLRPTLRATFA